MQLIENLKKIGLPEETINTYLEKGFIKSNGLGSYEIVNGDLLVTLITKCIACKINPNFLLMPNVGDYGDELDVLYVNLINNNYMMACEAAEMINKEVHTNQLDLFINTCKNYQDVNKYILKENAYGKDKATKDGLKKLERKLLLQLELFDYMNAMETGQIIVDIYKDYNSEFIYNFGELIRILNEMSSDHLFVSNRAEDIIMGTPSYVLNFLLQQDDIYRADDIINSELQKNTYSIEWQIYFAVMYQIKILNEKNLKAAVERTIVSASFDDYDNWAFPETTYPRMTKEEVLRIKQSKDIEVENVDYYSQYEKALFENEDYDAAKDFLTKHQKQAVLDYNNEVFDYLFEELDILKKNKELGVDMSDYSIALEFAMNYMEIEKYELALNYAAKCYNLLKVQNPRVLCILGKIYYKLNDLTKANYFYGEAFKKAVSPNDLADMIEVFFINKDYKKVVAAINRFNYYDFMGNAKVHYIAAAAYLKLGKYADSKNELKECTTILSGDENLAIEFVDEKEIIKKCERGGHESFGIEDYIDYKFSSDEFLIAQYLDENFEHAEKVFEDMKKSNANYAENLKYLLSVTKALFRAFDFDRGTYLCNKIDDIFNTDLLNKEDAKVMKKMLDNFKKL